jgi:hypothetical protein
MAKLQGGENERAKARVRIYINMVYREGEKFQ